MKKLTSVLLAGAIALSTSISVFADEPVTSSDTTIDHTDSNPSTADTTVKMVVVPTYTVTIPSEVTLSAGTTGYTGSGTISTTGAVRIAYGNKIYVTVASANGFNMVSAENASNPYVMTAGTKTITATANEVAVFEVQEEAQSVTLGYTADEPDYSGTFTDTLTFTIAVRSEAE